jgi:glutathione S-transferase
VPRRPTLYGYPISHYCISAERMLAFKRIPFDSVYVSYFDKRELIRATGQDYVPALVWDDTVVTWEQLPDFVEKRQPEPTLYPNGTRGQAKTLENWGHQVLEERVWRYVVTRVPPLFSDEVERWVFEELQTRTRGPWHILEQRREEFRVDMEKHFQLVEDMLENREWILGSPSLADFGIYGGLSPLLTVGEEIPTRFPLLRAWTRRVESIGSPPAHWARSVSPVAPLVASPE